MNILDYPVNDDVTNPPPSHWVSEFTHAAFAQRAANRSICAEYQQRWHPKQACAQPDRERRTASAGRRQFSLIEWRRYD